MLGHHPTRFHVGDPPSITPWFTIAKGCLQCLKHAPWVQRITCAPFFPPYSTLIKIRHQPKQNLPNPGKKKKKRSMEITTPLTTISPRHSFSHGLFLPSNLNPIPPPNTLNRRKPIVLKSVQNYRKTLSSDWALTTSSSGPWMPRLDELDTTNMLLRQRIVFLGSQVDTMTADLIISQLLFLDAEDQKKEIKLFINSPGGSVTAGMGIYDAMKLCKADVSTVCLGLAASMGAFLLASGTKGKRFCMPNARVMIHQPLGTAGGKATEMGLQIREMAYHKVKMNKIFSRITGKPEKQIEEDTDRDYFMNPWEAKEYGLVDAIIDDGKLGLVAPIAESTPPPKTRVWDLWKVEGSQKGKKNLPSEQKISQNGSEQEKEAATPV